MHRGWDRSEARNVFGSTEVYLDDVLGNGRTFVDSDDDDKTLQLFCGSCKRTPKTKRLRSSNIKCVNETYRCILFKINIYY